jgi:isopenicillin-N epimerase
LNVGQGLWQLDPSVIYLNHGSLGACPIPVLDAQRAWRDTMERHPVSFLLRELAPKMEHVRRVLGALVGADPDDLALVTNATTAVNTVLRSLDFQPGDELLTTNHEYNACLNSLDVVAQRTGARVVKAHVPFPVTDSGDILAPILAAVTPRTRLALISHVTSATGIIFPIREIVAALAARGVDVLVDGAHAPALLDLDVDGIGAAYYAATGHKWICSPKGTGFLHVRRDKQAAIRPLVISHGTNDQRTEISLFRREFDWQGSNDPSGFLALPVAVATLDGLVDGGLAALRQRNHDLALRAQDMLCDVLDTRAPVPPSMISAMTAVTIDHLFTDDESRTRLDRSLREEARFEVPVMRCRLDPGRPPRWLIRVSCQGYNDESDIDALRAALKAARPAGQK